VTLSFLQILAGHWLDSDPGSDDGSGSVGVRRQADGTKRVQALRQAPQQVRRKRCVGSCKLKMARDSSSPHFQIGSDFPLTRQESASFLVECAPCFRYLGATLDHEDSVLTSRLFKVFRLWLK
jgi:hypothetical protein